MFNKALILVLLGSSLVLAAPSADPSEGALDTLKSWYNNVTEKVKSYYHSVVENFDNFIDKIKAKGAYAAELGEDALAYLKEKAIAAKDATLAQIKAVKDQAAAEIESLKNSANKTAKVLAYEAKKITNAAEEKIAKIATDAKEKWQELEKEAAEYYAKEAEKKKAQN